MPSSSSFWAMAILSSTENETASPCVPSLSVVSKVWMRILFLSGCRFFFLRHAGFLAFFEERHHLAQLLADGFNRSICSLGAQRIELVAARLVFRDPLAGKLDGLNLGKDLAHFLARLVGDDARTARVVAILRRVRNRIAHITESALVNKID